MPITLVGGDKSFGSLLPDMARGLEDAGVRSVEIETIADCGHYPTDEKPAEVATLIELYASRDPPVHRQ